MGNRIQPRKKNGRFTRKGKFLKILALLVLIGGAFAGVSYRFEYDVAPAVHAEPNLEGKIEELKADVVERLKQCESTDATEDDAVINPHDGGSPSFGLLQFKLDTVQRYVKKFDGKDLTRYEALLLAMDEERSRELAERVIFDEIGGVFNWENCARKENLAPRIEVIRELDK